MSKARDPGSKQDGDIPESSPQVGRYWSSKGDFEHFLKGLSSVNDLSWDDLNPSSADPHSQPGASKTRAGEAVSPPEKQSPQSNPNPIFGPAEPPESSQTATEPPESTSKNAKKGFLAMDSKQNSDVWKPSNPKQWTSNKRSGGQWSRLLWVSSFLLLGIGIGAIVLLSPAQIEQALPKIQSAFSELGQISPSQSVDPAAERSEGKNPKIPPSANVVNKLDDPLSRSITLAEPPVSVPPKPPVRPSTSTRPVLPGRAQYNLQVAVCVSVLCADRYEQALLSAVTKSNIQRLRGTYRGKTVTRIQVGPFSKNKAQQLKRTLVLADPIFENAFLIRLQ